MCWNIDFLRWVNRHWPELQREGTLKRYLILQPFIFRDVSFQGSITHDGIISGYDILLTNKDYNMPTIDYWLVVLLGYSLSLFEVLLNLFDDPTLLMCSKNNQNLEFPLTTMELLTWARVLVWTWWRSCVKGRELFRHIGCWPVQRSWILKVTVWKMVIPCNSFWICLYGVYIKFLGHFCFSVSIYFQISFSSPSSFTATRVIEGVLALCQYLTTI